MKIKKLLTFVPSITRLKSIKLVQQKMIQPPLRSIYFGLFLCFFYSNAQERYQDPIFEEVIESSAIPFSTQVPQPLGSAATMFLDKNANVPEHETEAIDLYLDFYQPKEDDTPMRPLVILCFGGGFTGGSRGAGDIKTLAVQLAKRGYTTAAIDYRVGINLLDRNASERALYRGVQDVRAAVRFFRSSVNTGNPYQINPNQIYLAGPSAGGMIALHNAYMEEEERTPGTFAINYEYNKDGDTSNTQTIAIPDLGCLDCAGDFQNLSGKANGVIAFAGALGSLDFINSSEKISGLLFHSADDPIVPYECGVPYEASETSLTKVYGSKAIFDEAETKNAPIRLQSYQDRGHKVHTSDDTQIYPDILEISSSFLKQLVAQDNITLSTTEATTQNFAVVSKNPVSKQQPILVQTNESIRVSRILLVDISGKVVQENLYKNWSTKEMVTINNSARTGLHLLKLVTDDGREFTHKILLTD